MKTRWTTLAVPGWLALLPALALTACEEDAPPPPPPAPAAAPAAAAPAAPAPAPAPAAAPAPEEKKEDALDIYPYTPIGKKDPFKRWTAPADTFSVCPPSDPACSVTSNVPETPCTKYDVEQMRLVGIITGVASPRAYAELPDASLGCYMKIGTDVGKHGGKVIAITRKGVRIRERYGRPSSGPVPVNLYVLKLQEEEPMSGVPGEDEGPPQLVDDRGAWLGGGQRGTRPGPGSPGGGTAGESRFVGPDGKEYVIKQTVVGGTPPPAQGQGDGQQQDARPVWQRRVDAPAPPPPPSAPSPPPPPPPSGIFPGGAQDYGSPTPD